jgi:hypothetical protein
VLAAAAVKVTAQASHNSRPPIAAIVQQVCIERGEAGGGRREGGKVIWLLRLPKGPHTEQRARGAT